MKKMTLSLTLAALVFGAQAYADSENKPVNISGDLAKVTVTHEGKKMDITRNQDNANKLTGSFAKTSRPCPPFCIQPAVLAPGVDTIAELEVLDYLAKKEAGDDSILVVDSRTPGWFEKGSIPGAVNLPWTALAPSKGADPISMVEILTDQFGVKESEEFMDFSGAKTLVMFCNGMWCGQSPTNIKQLLKMGYPAHKIKWYRGGMQDWRILGLSTVKPSK